MEITKLAFAGTADEFKTVEHLFAGVGVVQKTTDQPGTRRKSTGQVADHTLLVKFIRRVISRRDLSPNQEKFLKIIDRYDDPGASGPDLARELKLKSSQFAGLTGAWWRRIYKTEGYSDDMEFCGWKYASDGKIRYWATPAFREALRLEGIV